MSAPTPSRRALLGVAAALPLAALPAVADSPGRPPVLRQVDFNSYGAGTSPPATPSPRPDAELIRICHEFAERQFDGWYHYVIAPGDDADEYWPADLDAYHWIVATPATTPAGWHAKALAYSAWHREAYDDEPNDRDSQTTFLASLLRDMLAPMRNAIIARLAVKYGPLPDSYTAEGIFVGYADGAPAPVAGAAAIISDAELLALADEWQSANTFVQKGSQRGNDIDDDAFDDVLDRRNATTGRIADIRAVTLAGMAAKARIVDDLIIEAECCDPNRYDQVARSLVRDVMALT